MVKNDTSSLVYFRSHEISYGLKWKSIRLSNEHITKLYFPKQNQNCGIYVNIKVQTPAITYLNSIFFLYNINYCKITYLL